MVFIRVLFLLVGLRMLARSWTYAPKMLTTQVSDSQVRGRRIFMVGGYNPYERNAMSSRNAGEALSSQDSVTLRDLNLRFKISQRQEEDLRNNKIQGQVGFIFSLENSMVDMEKVYGYTLATLSRDLRLDMPTGQQVREVIGLSMEGMAKALGWTLVLQTPQVRAQFEKAFMEVFESFLVDLPIQARPGAKDLLIDVMFEKNTVVVSTGLPRQLALKALGKTQLSEVFEGRLPPEHLVTPREADGRVRGQQLLRCCLQLGHPLPLVLALEQNTHLMLDAKRAGLTVIAVGRATSTQGARAADSLLTSLVDTSPDKLYALVSRAYSASQGPSPQPDSASASNLDGGAIRTKLLAPAAFFDDDKPPRPELPTRRLTAGGVRGEPTLDAIDDDDERDTFADEFGSDML